MGIFERPPGSGILWINYTNDKGQRKREKVGRSRASAEKLLIKRKEASRQAKLFPEEQKSAEAALTVKQLVTKYLPLFEAKKSYQDFKRYAEYCIKEFGGSLARDLKPSELDLYRIRRQKEGARPATINRCMAFLRRVFNLAAHDDLPLKNPVARLKKLPENNVQKEDWTALEEEKILAACQPKHRRMILLLLLTGMRGGEMLGRKIDGRWQALTWPQVDFSDGCIRLEDTKNGEDAEILMTPEIRAILEEQREAVPSGCKWVFPGRNSKEPYRRNGAYQVLQRACDRAGVPRKRLHSTRHAFCSQLIMAGADLKTVSQLARHSSIAITGDLYGHVDRAHRAEALGKLANRRTVEKQKLLMPESSQGTKTPHP